MRLPRFVRVGDSVRANGRNPGIQTIGESFLGLPGLLEQGTEMDRYAFRRENGAHFQKGDGVTVFCQIKAHFHPDFPAADHDHIVTHLRFPGHSFQGGNNI